jgi:hypothetical protein
MKRARIARLAGPFALAAAVVSVTVSGGTALAGSLTRSATRAPASGVVAQSYFCRKHPQDKKCVKRPAVQPSTGGGGTYSIPAGVRVVTGLVTSPRVRALPATGGGVPAAPAAPALPLMPMLAALLAVVGLGFRRLARRL